VLSMVFPFFVEQLSFLMGRLGIGLQGSCMSLPKVDKQHKNLQHG
jgi:hypothetical protein